MTTEAYNPKKVFTLEEANATLPLVRAIAGDLSRLAQDVTERRQRISHLMEGRELESGDPYTDELAHTQQELENDTKRLQEYVDELRQLGVEPKGALEGLVDFPAMIDGRLVFLCWKFDESEILYWHDLDGGFSGRQPLTASIGSSDAEPGFLEG